jgi:hypothetical protein
MKFCVFFCILVAASPVFINNVIAQNSSRIVVISGTVLDPSGASAPDSAVTLKQGNSRIVSKTTTDISGGFRFEGISPGNYSIEVQHKGFEVSTCRIKISTTPPLPLTIKLALARLVSEVSITAGELEQVSTAVAENRDAATADQGTLTKLPVFDQDYVGTMSMFLDSGAIGTSGAQLIVDGMEAKNVGVSASAIQEVRINQNPYSAEYSRPGRGSIEVITKSKTSEYHGTFNVLFRDSRLNARDVFSLVRAPEQRRIFEGVLTGPLGGSATTSFLLSGNRQEEDLQSIVFARNLSGLVQESVSSPKRNTQISSRAIHQFNESHTAFIQYNEWDYPSSNQGVGGLVLPEAAANSRQWERELIFNDRLTLSTHWLSQFQILLGLERHATTSVSPAPKIVVNGAFTGGGAQSDVLYTESHFQLNEIMSWSSGKHLVKFGLNVPDWSHRGIDNRKSFGGTFYFSDLQAYQAQQPYSFWIQQGSGSLTFLQKELGGFIQDEYRVRPNLSLSLGLRYNWQNYLHDNTDFAPRIAFAYGVGKKAKTVLRGGVGIFYDRTGANPLLDLLLYDGQHLRSYLISDPSYPDPLPKGVSLDGLPINTERLDPNVREPYTIQYSIGAERQVARKTTVAITYTGSRGVSLFRSRDINAPKGPDYMARPVPSLGAVYQIESSGRQVGNSLDFTLRGDVTHYLSGQAQYTLSRTDNNTGGITWLPANQYDLSGEWSRADFDQRHRLRMLESFIPGKLFIMGLAFTANSGKPYSMTTGQDPYHTGLANARPPGVPRNSLEGPSSVNLDLRLSRNFIWNKKEKEKGLVTTFALDAFNVLNHVNYASFEGDLSSPFFGHAVSAMPTRRIQMTLRFEF